MIETPGPGQTVEKKDVVTVRTAGPGQPILAVRSKQPGSSWWIQDLPETSGAHTFVVPARFGNDATRQGTRFEIAALIAPDKEAAASLAPGASLKELPSGWIHSAIKEVVVAASAPEIQRQTKAAELVTPKPDAQIERLQKVVFRVPEASEVSPLLLVRSGEPNSPWWVQQPLEAGGQGLWDGTARIGNGQTPAGSMFHLMLVFPQDAAAGDEMKAGTTLSDVSMLSCSQTFTVTKHKSHGETDNESEPLSSAD
jgi:hypothetical protein